MIEQRNWSALREIADELGKRTKGTYNGCIGALDGLTVQVKVLPMSGTLAIITAKKVSMHVTYKPFATGRTGFYGVQQAIREAHMMIAKRSLKHGCMTYWTRWLRNWQNRDSTLPNIVPMHLSSFY